MKGLALAGVLLAAWLTTGTARAQEDGDDFDSELWLELGLDVRVTKRFHVDVDQMLRLNADWTQVTRVMTELSPSFRVTKFLRLEGGYRFIVRDAEEGYELRHRFFGGVRFDVEIGRFQLDLRLRYQEQDRYEDIPIDTHTARARLRSSYRFGDTTLLLAYEMFVRLAEIDSDVRAQKWRVTLGAQYDLGDVTLGPELKYEDFFVGDRASVIFGLTATAHWRP